jgi:hypothetical protein
MLERSFIFSFMAITYLPLAGIYFGWIWIDLHDTHIDQTGFRSRTVIYCVYTIIGLWSFATLPLLAFGNIWFSVIQSLVLLILTGLVCCISGWWLFGWWVMERPASARRLLRFRSLQPPLQVGLFGCLLNTFLLFIFFSPPFRLMIIDIYSFRMPVWFLLILPIEIIAILTTVFLAKFIEAGANNKVKE